MQFATFSLDMACVVSLPSILACTCTFFFLLLFLSDMIPIIDCEGRRACISSRGLMLLPWSLLS